MSGLIFNKITLHKLPPPLPPLPTPSFPLLCTQLLWPNLYQDCLASRRLDPHFVELLFVCKVESLLSLQHNWKPPFPIDP